jgi:RecA/RadA recombinase
MGKEMSSLLNRMQKAGVIKTSEVLSESSFFNIKDIIPTELPILNIAFSGDLSGGLVSGLTIFAGLSKSFKTLLGLYCMKAYMDKYPDSIALFFDSEFGCTPEYIKSHNIDTDRVLHIPVENLEQLKFDMIKRLEELSRNDKVFIFLDSISAIPSSKETEDALDGKSVADMTRAKSIRSLLRIITPHLTMKDIPCIVITHVYNSMELYSKVIIPGGMSVSYLANQIFVITKAQEKDGTDLVGYNFTINIEKSRFVKEKSKFPFTVTWDGGIQKYSGLLDIALDGGFVVKPANGWYAKVDNDGIIGDKHRFKKTQNSEFWESIITNDRFKQFIKKKYQLSFESKMIQDDIENNEDD